GRSPQDGSGSAGPTPPGDGPSYGSGPLAGAVPGPRPPVPPPVPSHSGGATSPGPYVPGGYVPEQRRTEGSAGFGGVPPQRDAGGARAPGAVSDLRRATTGPGVAATTQGRRLADGPTVRPAGLSRQSLVFAAVAAVFALLLTAGVAIMIMERPGGTDVPTATTTPREDATRGATREGTQTPGRAAAVLDVPATTRGCAAARVAGAGAACVVTPECWAGLVSISGDVTARPLPCTGKHAWETFAVAPLPAGLSSSDQDTVSRHPTVAGLCTISTLLSSRRGRAATVTADRWEVAVLPPSAARFAAGDRTYRCIGRVTGSDRSGAVFASS
ncbi:hypothetical protein MPTA5024_03430, partial [Microbispora sp. ATCC PTA-5024]